MNTQTSLVAAQIRLQQWANQIKDCQNRPADMKVDAWCQEHGITKANYYYRLRIFSSSPRNSMSILTGNWWSRFVKIRIINSSLVFSDIRIKNLSFHPFWWSLESI